MKGCKKSFCIFKLIYIFAVPVGKYTYQIYQIPLPVTKSKL